MNKLNVFKSCCLNALIVILSLVDNLCVNIEYSAPYYEGMMPAE